MGAVVNGSRRRGNKSSATAAAAPHHCTWARWGLAELQTNPIPPTPSPSACPPIIPHEEDSGVDPSQVPRPTLRSGF